jgi:hypothetical protein
MTYRRTWERRATEVARHAGPKREGLWGPADLLPTGHAPISNPAESATLRLRNTGSRNVGTALGRSGVASWWQTEQGDVPNRRPEERWDGPRSEGSG